MNGSALEGIEILLIDGNNLLHRVSGSVDPSAQRTLIPRLRGAIPPTIATVFMLDGHADSGTSRSEKIGRGFEIRHSGSASADDAIMRLIQDTPANERSGVTVVSLHDTQEFRARVRALRDRAHKLGAHPERLSWIEALIGLPSPKAGAIGSGPPPKRSQQDPKPDDVDRTPWTPGRGATKKRGNPRRRGRQG